MRKFLLSIAALVAIMLPLFCTAPAQAQATRTWVSGVGDDANPCSRTAPCKTFAGAISKTAAGGEINCLDPGGYGAVTITKALTISCEAGTAGVLVSGTNAIIVNAGATDFVTLRGLDIEGLGTGLIGVEVLQAAAVYVQKCTIQDFRSGTGAGIGILPSSTTTNVFVSDTYISGNAVGILVKPAGTGVARLLVDRVQTDANNIGIKVDGTTSSGIGAVMKNSTAGANGQFGVQAIGSAAFLQIDQSSISGNPGTGVNASTSATIRISNSTVFGNGTGVSNSSATFQSYRNNMINGNGTDGTPLTAIPGGFASGAGLN